MKMQHRNCKRQDPAIKSSGLRTIHPWRSVVSFIITGLRTIELPPRSRSPIASDVCRYHSQIHNQEEGNAQHSSLRKKATGKLGPRSSPIKTRDQVNLHWIMPTAIRIDTSFDQKIFVSHLTSNFLSCAKGILISSVAYTVLKM